MTTLNYGDTDVMKCVYRYEHPTDGRQEKKKIERKRREGRAPARKRMRYFSVVVFRLRPTRDPATDVPGRRPRPGLRPSSIVAGADSDASSCVQSSSFARVEKRNEERERNTGRRGSDSSMSQPGLGLGQFAFVGTFIAAVKKTIAGQREEPPEHLKCVITQELFRDPVILVQTGYTYDRKAIERWLSAKFPPTDPTSNVELWCTDLVPNWSLRQVVDEWGIANGYGAMDPPEEAVRVSKDGRPTTRRSANATSAAALTHQYLQALHRTHPRHAAVLVFLMTFTLGTITVTTLTVAHSVYTTTAAALQHEKVAWLLKGPVQSAIWWGGVGLFLWLANAGNTLDPMPRRRANDGARRFRR